MISFQVKSTRISIHPLFPALIVLCLWAGGSAFPALLALLTHEAGHLLCASLLGFRIGFIEITPFGGLIGIDGLDESRRFIRFLVAFSGPLFSLLGCVAATVLYRKGFMSFDTTRSYLRGGTVLLLINLLPALPLDGGRMLQTILGAFIDEKKVTHALLFTAKIIAAALCGISLAFAIRGHYSLLPFMAGAYLFYAASREGKSAALRYVSQLIGRRLTLDKDNVLRVQLLAAGENTPAVALLSRLTPHKFHIVYVLSRDGLTVRGELDENRICSALMSGAEQTLGELVSIKNSQ